MRVTLGSDPAGKRTRLTVQTLDRGLQVLELILENPRPWTVPEMSRALGLHRSIVQRLARTLESRGYLARQPGGSAYSLGVTLALLGSLVPVQDQLAQGAHAELRDLARRTGETVSLAVLRDGRSQCVAAVESHLALKVSYKVGFAGPLHAGATGQVLLAFAPRAVAEMVLRLPLEAYTEATITEPAVLAERLDLIRRLGYGVSVGELDPGVFAVAVPILSRSGQLVASVTISGPEDRFGGRTDEYVRLATEAAARIAERLNVRHTGT